MNRELAKCSKFETLFLFIGWTICCLSLTEINGKQAIILGRMQPHKESALVKVDIDAEGVSVGYITEFNPI